MNVVADSGFVIAYMNKRDRYHASALAAHRQATTIFLPQTTLAEIAYLITHLANPQVLIKFLEEYQANKFKSTALEDSDISQATEILKQYADSRIDFVDATVMAVAERLKLTTVFTVDHRDFSIYRPSHCPFFTLLPEPI